MKWWPSFTRMKRQPAKGRQRFAPSDQFPAGREGLRPGKPGKRGKEK